LGTNIQEEAFFDALIGDAASKAGVSPVLAPPAGVEASVRESAGKQLLFLINHTEETQHVAVPAPATALLGGLNGGQVELGAYGVAVLKLG